MARVADKAKMPEPAFPQVRGGHLADSYVIHADSGKRQVRQCPRDVDQAFASRAENACQRGAGYVGDQAGGLKRPQRLGRKRFWVDGREDPVRASLRELLDSAEDSAGIRHIGVEYEPDTSRFRHVTPGVDSTSCRKNDKVLRKERSAEQDRPA